MNAAAHANPRNNGRHQPAVSPDVNPDMERTALGCVLFDGKLARVFDEWPPAVATLEHGPHPFHELKHYTIFQAIQTMRADGVTITLQTLQAQLLQTGKLELAGGVPYIAGLEDDIFSLDQVPDLAKMLLVLWRKRYVKVVSAKYIQTDEHGERVAEALALVESTKSHGIGIAERGRTAGELLGATATDAPGELVKTGYFRRGHVLTMAAASGVGKSTFAYGLAVHFAAGLPYFGLTPSQPMLIGIADSENDGEDIRGIIGGAMDGAGGQIDVTVLNQITHYPLSDITGEAFGLAVDEMLRGKDLDLLIIDNAHSFIGGEFNQENVTRFMREVLIAKAIQYKVGILLIHHSVKPMRSGTKAVWSADDFSYESYGPSELTNASRAILSIQGTPIEGVYQLRASKRRQRLGWADPVRFIAHGDNPHRPYWREATVDEILDVEQAAEQAKGGRTAKAKGEQAKQAIIAIGGMVNYAELYRAIASTHDCSDRTAKRSIADALEAGIIRKNNGGFYELP